MNSATGTAEQAVRPPAAALNSARDATASKSLSDNAAAQSPPPVHAGMSNRGDAAPSNEMEGSESTWS
jgi:hypothetical protein